MQKEPIAIIGIGCRFPDAASPATLFQNLLDEKNSIRSIPKDRILLKQAANASELRNRIPDFGGYLEDMEMFDSALFRFSPREAESTDPQQRLMLQVTWEALEDGAVSLQKSRGTHVPVFVGALGMDYQHLLFSDANTLDLYGAVNTTFAALAGRIGHFFDWSGPAVGLDTACSSSLTAMHLACQAIWAGNAEMAVFGGANLLITPEPSLGYTRAGMLSWDGQCKAFDASGNGFVRSEGVAAIVVKRLSAALRDGNPIYAVVRSTWLNHDGGTGQYKTPNRAGQRRMIEEAYATAGLSPLDTQYAEAHGTGTRAGDPVEVGAISDVLCAGRSPDAPLFIGSIKTNIGHCEAAAGMAGVIKVALALKHRVIPKNLHFNTPNPAIAWDTLALRVPTETMAWPSLMGKPARGSVSAFGLTGVNAHVILEEAPPSPSPKGKSDRSHLWVVSAPDDARVRATCDSLYGRLTQEPMPIEAVARTLACGRTHHDVRAAVWGESLEELLGAVEAIALGEPNANALFHTVTSQPSPICFVFSGQGGQWIGMGRTLLEDQPAFRQALEEVSEAIRQEADFSPLDELACSESESRLNDLAIVQPTLFAVQIALAKMWQNLGVYPTSVVGHSMGEVAAAYIAGILDLDSAVKVICRRSRLMKTAPGKGAMLVVDLSEAEIEQIVSGAPDAISLGVHNSPRSRVLSGDEATLKRIASQLEARGAFARFVNVDVASHSPQMQSLQHDVLDALKDVVSRPGNIAFHSTVRRKFGRRPEDGAFFDGQYWWENLRNPVRFADAIADIVEQGIDTFIEINPHPLLCQAIQQTEMATSTLAAFPSMRRQENERSILLRTAAELYVRGAPVKLEQLVDAGPLLRLPPMSLLRERFPIDYSKRQASKQVGTSETLHALPIEELRFPDRPDEIRWLVTISPQEQRLWEGHAVEGEIIFPGAGYVDLGFSIAQRILGKPTKGQQCIEAETFSFERALFLEPSEHCILHVVAKRTDREGLNVAFFTEKNGQHANGTFVCRLITEPEENLSTSVDWATGIDSHEPFYAWLRTLGLEYTGAFQGVSEVYYGEGRGLARLAENVNFEGAGGFTLHPALLDACFQVAFSTTSELRLGEPSLFLPTRIRSLHLFAESLIGASWVTARRDISTVADELVVDLYIWDESGRILAQVKGFTAQRLDAVKDSEQENVLWELDWPALPLPNLPPLERLAGQCWLVRMDDGGIGANVADLLEEQGCRVWRIHRSLRAADAFQIIEPRRVRMRADAPEHYSALLSQVTSTDGHGITGVLDFWPLLEHPVETLRAEQLAVCAQRVCVPVIELVKALAENDLRPRLWLMTQNVWNPHNEEAACRAVASALWGLGRVVAVEHPEFRATLVDLLGHDNTLGEIIVQEIAADRAEREIQLSRTIRRVSRLSQSVIPKADEVTTENSDSDASVPFWVEWSKKKVSMHAANEPIAQVTDVVIEVEAFRCPCEKGSIQLGTLLGGRVCKSTSAGDAPIAEDARVVWVGPTQPLRSVMAVPAAELWVLPNKFHLPDVVASVGPYLAVFHGLVAISRLTRGDRVLIAGAKEFAVAAAFVARWARAQVVILISKNDRQAFSQLGLRNVVESDDANAATQIREAFLDQRADVFFVTGEVPTGLKLGDVLEPDGRCVWLTSEFQSPPRISANQSLYSISIDQPLRSHDRGIRESLASVRTLIEHGSLPLLTAPHIKLSELASAPEVEGSIIIEHPRLAIPKPDGELRSDASYLITGGLGGLGLTIAHAMCEQGARSIVLIGRRAPAANITKEIDELRTKGIVVTILQADVSNAMDVQRVMDYIAASLPPLRGIVHSAGILADAIVLRQDAEHFLKVFPAKANGAWNIVRSLGSVNLDFFVMFSSVAGLIGSPGQSNYAAANTFLDGLAHALRARGVPAKTVQWGPWAEVGLAARPDRGGRLSSRGLLSFSPHVGAQVFMEVLRHPGTVLAAMRFDPHIWVSSTPSATDDPRYENVLKRHSLVAAVSMAPPRKLESSVLNTLSVTKNSNALEHTQGMATIRDTGTTIDKLQVMVAQLVRVTPSRIDMRKAITAQGLDSLMMVELRSRIQQAFSVDIPMSTLVKGPNLQELCRRVIDANPTLAEPEATIDQLKKSNDKTLKLTEIETNSPDKPFLGDALSKLRIAMAKLIRVSENRIDTRRSITAQGLDSLMMVELRAYIETTFGVNIPMAALVKGPSLEGIAQQLNAPVTLSAPVKTNEIQFPTTPTQEDASPTYDLVLPSHIRPQREYIPRPVKRILLTGATGFLGRVLVSELLRQGASEVICIVRGITDEDAHLRLKSMIDKDVRDSTNLTVVRGDLEDEFLGLGRDRFVELVNHSDAIVHNGAVVHFHKTYKAMRQTNVVSWLDFIRESANTLPTLHFVSSWAVFSTSHHAGKPASEQDWPSFMPDGGYREAKYVAEMLALEASKRGFPVQVHRPALISLHSKTGASNPKELFSALVAMAIEFGYAPDINISVPFAPVDAIAEGMARMILRNPLVSHAFHWSRTEHIRWDRLIDWLVSEGINVEKIPYQAWREKMAAFLVGHPLEPFIAFLPADFGAEGLGYVESVLEDSQPTPFDNRETKSLVPGLLEGDGIDVKAWRMFVQRC